MSIQRVLVVDDEPAITKMLETFLVSRGCDVRTAGSAERALGELEGWEPEVALVDLVLPDRGGGELLVDVKQLFPETEVIVMTGRAPAESIVQAVRCGAAGYLEKPFPSLGSVWTQVQRAGEQRSLRLGHRELFERQETMRRRLSSAVDFGPEDEDPLNHDDLKDVFDRFLDVVVAELDVARVSLMLLDKKTGALRVVASRGSYVVNMDEVRVPLGEGVAGAVAASGEPILVADTGKEAPVRPGNYSDLSRSFISAPVAFNLAIRSAREVLGVINVTNRRSGEPFNTNDLSFLAGLAKQLGTVIENSIESHRLQRAYRSLKATQDRLVFVERVKAVGQMAAGVAHDLNNLLGIVIARAESALHLVDREPFDRDRLRDHIETVVRSSLQGSEVIKRIQDYTRQRREAEHVPVRLNAVVRDAIDLARPKWRLEPGASGRSIEMQTELADLPPVSGNQYELIQVVGNLIFNAVDAMPEGGTIRFRTRVEGASVVLECEDTGIGMDEKTRHRLFEPFFTTKESGQGLGTSIICDILARHEGSITAESAPGEGSTFTVRLPAATMPFVATTHAATPGEELVSARLLLVDDDRSVIETFEEALRIAGHVVLSASNGAEALELCDRERIDVVLTDLCMTDMSGLELTRRIKSRHADLAVILFSGSTDPSVERDAARAGAERFVRKPCRLEHLLEQIAVALRTATTPVST